MDIVCSVADLVLETLKSKSLKDFDKKKEIESVIGSMNNLNETFSQFVNLVKKIMDYGAEDKDVVDLDIECKDAEIDNEVGIAVVFDEEEQDEDEDENNFKVQDESDDSDVEGEESEGDNGQEGAEMDTDEQVMFGGDGESSLPGRESLKKTEISSDSDMVAPHEVNGFWVQCQISSIYLDPVTLTSKAASVLDILGSSQSSLRDCENQLMDLFEYQSFEVIRKFLKNRDIIVWCTKLVRSSEEERKDVEVTMRKKGIGWILRELVGDRKSKHKRDGIMVK
jgi:pre-mRNA-splicing helicase BRR2